MDLRGARRIDAAEIQSFLEQSKAIAEIGQRMNRPRRAQTVEDSRVSLPFDPLEKAVQRVGHLGTVHAGIFSIRPKITLRLVSAHFGETSSCCGLDVGERCDLADRKSTRLNSSH